MATSYTERAVAALAAWISSALPAQLRTVETADGLGSGDLTDPIAVVAGRVHFDHRSPLIEVFDRSWTYDGAGGFRERLLLVDCSVMVSYLHPDADIVSGELFMRRYLTAILRTLEQDPTLGGQVSASIPTDGAIAAIPGDQSLTREVFEQGVEVHVHSP